MEMDQIVADIITNELEIDPERVVCYGQNFVSPKDGGLYVVISMRTPYILGSKTSFDYDTNEEIKEVSMFVDLDVEITSKDRSAVERKEEIIMALTSFYSIKQQEEKGFKLFRNSSIIDLTFVDGSASLYRFKAPITATYNKTKRTEVQYFDKYRSVETDIQRK